MYCFSGGLGASGSVILIFERISSDTGAEFADVFMYLTIGYASSAIINLIFFTPVNLPTAATNIRQ